MGFKQRLTIQSQEPVSTSMVLGKSIKPQIGRRHSSAPEKVDKGNALPVLKGANGKYPKCPRCWSTRLIEKEVSQCIVYTSQPIKGSKTAPRTVSRTVSKTISVPSQYCMNCEFVNSLVPKREWRKLKDAAKRKVKMPDEKVSSMAKMLNEHYAAVAKINTRIADAASKLTEALGELELCCSVETAIVDVWGGVPPHLGDPEFLQSVRQSIEQFSERESWAPGDTMAWTALVLKAQGIRNQKAIANGFGISTRQLQKRIQKIKKSKK